MERIKCLIVDDEELAIEVIASHVQKIPGLEITATCNDAMEASAELQKQTIDLIFLDINMPEISGLDFLKHWKQLPQVILTTAYRDHALEAFDLNVLDYLVKPISFPRLLQAVQKFQAKQQVSPLNLEKETASKQKHIVLRSEKKNVKVKFDELLYVESQKDYLNLFLKNGSTIHTKMPLSELETLLPKSDFLRIHRSFLIPLNLIRSFNREFIDLESTSLPIGKTYQKQVLSILKAEF